VPPQGNGQSAAQLWFVLLPLNVPLVQVRVCASDEQTCPTGALAAEYAVTLWPLEMVPPHGSAQYWPSCCGAWLVTVAAVSRPSNQLVVSLV
jgi:hypothetical protein